MKSLIVCLVALTFLFSSNALSQTYSLQNCEVTVKSSFRGLSVVDDSIVWVSGSNGWIGRSTNGSRNWKFNQVTGFEKLDFRSLYAFNSQRAIIANAGSPAHILQTTDGGNTWQIVYQNNHPDAFFDGVGFWNDREGMIYGDPIGGRMLVLITKDGGKTWTELPESQRPLLKEGEASFAASGTGIRCYDKSTVMIATGGKVSRLFTSGNSGKSWKIVAPPIIQGESSTGIFSVAFRDKKNGVVVGGDFQKDSLNIKHILLTSDAGKTWSPPTAPTRGYRECVEYISNEVLIATGPSGTDISINEGKDWHPLSDEKGFHVVRKARKGKLVVLAGGERISRLKKGQRSSSFIN
jgi:photosystem II stability/assembly factor-like uncharacterized protein